jgi:prevent-host-death family protein
MEIGIRELRDGLSHHLADVRDGHTVTVTDHGRPIARIVPVGVPTRLEQLRAEGRIMRAPRRKSAARSLSRWPEPSPTWSTTSVGDRLSRHVSAGPAPDRGAEQSRVPSVLGRCR